jgi:hypothetical protein
MTDDSSSLSSTPTIEALLPRADVLRNLKVAYSASHCENDFTAFGRLTELSLVGDKRLFDSQHAMITVPSALKEMMLSNLPSSVQCNGNHLLKITINNTPINSVSVELLVRTHTQLKELELITCSRFSSLHLVSPTLTTLTLKHCAALCALTVEGGGEAVSLDVSCHRLQKLILRLKGSLRGLNDAYGGQSLASLEIDLGSGKNNTIDCLEHNINIVTSIRHLRLRNVILFMPPDILYYDYDHGGDSDYDHSGGELSSIFPMNAGGGLIESTEAESTISLGGIAPTAQQCKQLEQWISEQTAPKLHIAGVLKQQIVVQNAAHILHLSLVYNTDIHVCNLPSLQTLELWMHVKAGAMNHAVEGCAQLSEVTLMLSQCYDDNVQYLQGKLKFANLHSLKEITIVQDRAKNPTTPPSFSIRGFSARSDIEIRACPSLIRIGGHQGDVRVRVTPSTAGPAGSWLVVRSRVKTRKNSSVPRRAELNEGYDCCLMPGVCISRRRVAAHIWQVRAFVFCRF